MLERCGLTKLSKTIPYIAVDFEANSLEYYRDDFKVVSMAISFYDDYGEIHSYFSNCESEILDLLDVISNYPLIVHNVQYEWGIFKNVYKHLNFNVYCDTQRLMQVYDNSDKYLRIKKKPPLHLVDNDFKAGLSLVACASRILSKEYTNHKDEAYKWIEENLGIYSGHGKYLSQLPEDFMRRYNCGDTETTLRLFKAITDKFKDQHYNWEKDHKFFLHMAKRISESKGRGIKVTRDNLRGYIDGITNEVEDMETRFCDELQEEIESVIKIKRDAYTNCTKLKTDRGRDDRRKKCDTGMVVFGFSCGSPKDKSMLFLDVMGFEPEFTTDSGGPSFASNHIHQFGRGGVILQNRGKRLLIKGQAENLLILSEYDGRWHMDLKATGTATGRMAGGENE